jgi:hypothetical protein
MVDGNWWMEDSFKGGKTLCSQGRQPLELARFHQAKRLKEIIHSSLFTIHSSLYYLQIYSIS